MGKKLKTVSKSARRRRDKAAIRVSIKQLNDEIDQFIKATLDRMQKDAVFGKKWRA